MEPGDSGEQDQGGLIASTPCSCSMLRRTARHVTQYYDRALQPVGLKVTQFAVLANVNRHDGMTISQLAARMVIDRTTLTRNLRPMIKADWIQLRASGKRAQAVHLTPRGKALAERARPLWQEAERDFRARMGDEQHQALRMLLDTAITRLEQSR